MKEAFLMLFESLKMTYETFCSIRHMDSNVQFRWLCWKRYWYVY